MWGRGNAKTLIANERLKSILRLVLPIVLGFGLLWWLYRDIDWGEVRSILETKLNYGVLAFSLIFGLGANVVRGLRWQLLIDPLTEGQPRPRLRNAIYTILGSYTVNMVIPRAGELWRCAEYKRREQIPFSSLLGTLITDRLTDVICLGLILVGVALANPDFFLGLLGQGRDWQGLLADLLGSPWLYLAFVLALLGFYALARLLKRHPEHRISQALHQVWAGIQSVRVMKYRGLFIIYSMLIWLGYFGFFYTAFFAFPFTRELSVGVALIAFGMSALSVLVPVQNGMGAWHWIVVMTLATYGVLQTDAKSFALIVHLTQTLWVTIVGLMAIIILPITNRGYVRIQQHNTSDKQH